MPSLLMRDEMGTVLTIYDPGLDLTRPATQADIDELAWIQQAYGALIMALRDVSKQRPGIPARKRCEYLREIAKVAECGAAG